MAVSLLTLSTLVQAASITYDGNFTHTNDYALYDFNVSQASAATFYTDSFIPGFDPVLTLYDATGALVAQNDDNAIFGGQDYWDSTISLANLLGDYTLAITRFAFFPGNDLNTAFLNVNQGSPMSGDYSYYRLNASGDYLTEANATVPEPGVLALTAIGLIGFGFARKNRQSFGDFSRTVA